MINHRSRAVVAIGLLNVYGARFPLPLLFSFSFLPVLYRPALDHQQHVSIAPAHDVIQAMKVRISASPTQRTERGVLVIVFFVAWWQIRAS